jgi:hypothetical protein
MSTNNILNIKINEEYANLVPRLSTSEYESLKEDVKQNGVQLPITINKDGDILDGRHRYRIWVVDLGRPVKEMPRPTVLDYSKDKLQEKLFVINVNLKRRHLNDFQQTSATKFLFVSALEYAEEFISILPGVKPNDIIKKPIQRENLVEKVKEILAIN